jgi:ketosteroid isomerase-like protein
MLGALASLMLAASTPAYEAAKADIWAQEQAIYKGRSQGDLGAYQRSLAGGYLAWPPHKPAPAGADGLRQTAKSMQGASGERLTMTLVDFALNGDTAIIYYSNHRTALPDGTPVDQVYETTHTWVRQDGVWKVLGGMARLKPERK